MFQLLPGHNNNTFDGRLMLSMHYVDPKDARPTRQPMFIEADDSGDRLVIKKDGLVIK